MNGNEKRIRSLDIGIAYLLGCRTAIRDDPKMKTQRGTIKLAALKELNALNDCIEMLRILKAGLK